MVGQKQRRVTQIEELRTENSAREYHQRPSKHWPVKPDLVMLKQQNPVPDFGLELAESSDTANQAKS